MKELKVNTINMRTKTIYDTLAIKRPSLIMNYTILASIYIDIDIQLRPSNENLSLHLIILNSIK